MYFLSDFLYFYVVNAAKVTFKELRVIHNLAVNHKLVEDRLQKGALARIDAAEVKIS